MKLLPIGIQTFSEIIKDNYIYVDKTKDIYSMVSTGKIYFLSRPRRFGKSLLVSTLESLFKGEKELFKNLYIQDKWNWEDKYPVIKLDMTKVNSET
ncbi:MAG: AAA family ATPase, partial [Methanobrevibacter sp.]|nr:AAA family ATPase [Methanobrevibacter sp.]